MSTQVSIKFFPEGFAECLNGMDDMVRDEAERLAAQAMANMSNGNLTVEVVHEPRFHDAAYGVARPVAVARIIANAAASREEAEDKTMSKAVY